MNVHINYSFAQKDKLLDYVCVRELNGLNESKGGVKYYPNLSNSFYLNLFLYYMNKIKERGEVLFIEANLIYVSPLSHYDMY